MLYYLKQFKYVLISYINAAFLDKMQPSVTTQETKTEIETVTEKEITNNCSICLDDISGVTNKIVTECGHTFHTSCLMKNASINGFACPYCRNEMAPKPISEDEDIDVYDHEGDGNYIDDYAFRGLRWFTQRIEGEELDEDTEDTSVDEEDYQDQEQDNCIVTNGGLRLPTPKYIMEKLQEKHIMIEQLITTLIICEHEDAYNLNDTTFSRMNSTRDRVFGTFRSIMNDFRV